MGNDWNESLGAAIESAAGALPDGYHLRLLIKRHGLSAQLVMPNKLVVEVDRETIVDEIEALTERAIKDDQQRQKYQPDFAMY